MKRVTFWVAGVPIPQGSMKGFVDRASAIAALRSNNPGLLRVRIISDNPQLKGWRGVVEYKAKTSWLYEPLSEVPVSVFMVFSLPRPLALPKRRYSWPTKKPDIDKLTRAILDALTGVCFQDDAMIVRTVAIKRYAALDAEPGVSITVVEHSPTEEIL